MFTWRLRPPLVLRAPAPWPRHLLLVDIHAQLGLTDWAESATLQELDNIQCWIT